MLVSPEVLSTMLDAVDDGVYHADLERRIVHWNQGSHRITGHKADQVIGRRCQDRVVRHVDGSGRALCDSPDCPLVVPVRTGKPHHAELFLHHEEGHLLPVSVQSQPFRGEDGAISGITLVFRGRTESDRTRTDGEIWKHAALTDALTGVGNRRAFRQAWTRAHRAYVSKSVPFGALMVDVDHFKAVNDGHGHPVGDKVLKTVARTLAASIRQRDCVIRWGGEEFLILVLDASAATLADLAERIRKLVERSWVVLPNGGHLGVTVSIGGALVRPDDKSATLVARADERLFACKSAGRNRSQIAP